MDFDFILSVRSFEVEEELLGMGFFHKAFPVYTAFRATILRSRSFDMAPGLGR